MYASNFNLDLYLKRIGYQQPVGPDIQTVTALMKQQLRTVAFENLDVQAGKIVSLVPEQIVDKIVGQGRGGYCYEVNGLFAMALQALGFTLDELREARLAPVVDFKGRKPKTDIGEK